MKSGPASPCQREEEFEPLPSDEDLEVVKKRVASGCPVLGLRFTGDPMVPEARFQRLRDELGDDFEAVEIDSKKGNPHGFTAQAHSVVTPELVDEAGRPTREALDRVLTLFEQQLKRV
jgi:dienelactone hydrolase